MQNITASSSTMVFEDLYPAILECFGVILLGYIAGKTGIIPASNAKGLGKYVSYFALPALVFKAMVEMDFSSVNWLYWCSILISKTIVFSLVYIGTLLIGRKLDIGKAGIYAIFASQSNDFALGYPIITSIYSSHHPDFVSYLYLVGPISLAILNPIGFVSMEVQRNRQATHQQSRLAVLSRIIRGLVTNPIIVMVVLGIMGNFAFDHTMPKVISDFLSVLASSFSATALFFLGTGMVGKMRKMTNLFFLTPLLLIGCKLILMPLVIRQVVLVLNPGGANDNLTDSFSSYGFLYGTIPTAPSVYVFATLYQQSEDVIASSMVLCTFVSAPMMFITATMVNMPMQSGSQTQALLSDVTLIMGCVGIACCVWILIVFLLSRRFKFFPHHFTTQLVVAQLLASLGVLLLSVIGSKPSWAVVLNSLVMLVGVFSTRCWAALIAIALCMMRCRSLCFVLRFKLVFYIYGWVVPVLLVVILAISTPPVHEDSSVKHELFLYGQSQLIISAVVLGLNFWLTVIALVVLHRRDRYRHLDQPQTLAAGADCSTSAGETERMLKKPQREGGPDIEDLQTSYQTCTLAAGCSDGQREACRRRTQRYLQATGRAMGGTDMDPEDVVASQQLGRHYLLLLLLLLSMIIGFSMCVWRLSGEPTNSLYLMLEFLDIVLLYCQGFFALAIFGFDTQHVIIPFCNVLRRWLCKKKTRRSSTDSEELDSDTEHTVQQFTQYHMDSCKREFLRRTSLGEDNAVFHGAALVDWLVEVGLALDRDSGIAYGKRLLLGEVIGHADNGHGFQDSRRLYRFCDPEERESAGVQVVT